MNGMWLLLVNVLLSGLYHVTQTRTIPAFVMVDEVALDNKLTPKHAHNEPSIFNGISGKSAKSHEFIFNSHHSDPLTFQENPKPAGSGVKDKTTSEFPFFPPDRVDPTKDITSHHGRKKSHGPAIKVTSDNDVHKAVDKVYKKGKTFDYNEKYKAATTSKMDKTYPSGALRRLKEIVLTTVPTSEMATAANSGSTVIPTALVPHLTGTPPVQTTQHSNIELSSRQTTSDLSFPITTTGDVSPGNDPSVDTTVFSTKEQLLPESTTVSTRDRVTLSKVDYTTKTTEPPTSTTGGTQISIPDVSEVNTNQTQTDTSSTTDISTTAVFDIPTEEHLGMGSSTVSSTENGHVLQNVTPTSSLDINSEFETTSMESSMWDGNSTITGDAVESSTPETGYSSPSGPPTTAGVHNTTLSQASVSSQGEGEDFRDNLVDSVVAAKINEPVTLDKQMEGVKALFSAADPQTVDNLSTTQDSKTPTLLSILSNAMSTITSQQSKDGHLVTSDNFSWYLSPGNRVRSRSVIDQSVDVQQDTTTNTTTSTNATTAPATNILTTTTQTTTTSTTTTTTVPTTTTTSATTTSTTTSTTTTVPDYCYVLCQIGQCPPSCRGRVGGWSR